MIKDYISLDLEMTGLNPKIDKILEIGAVKVVDGNIIEEYDRLINPGVGIDERITDITGIDREMVKDCPYIEDVLPEFIDFCEDYVIIGHNLSFDYAFLKKNAVNIGLSYDKYGIDTLKIARSCLMDLGSKSLENLCRHFGIEDKNHHRALNDAYVTHKFYRLMCEEKYVNNEKVFQPVKLEYKVKKDSPATPRQIKNLNDLIKYHKIIDDIDISRLSRSEASRYTDKILSQYGRVKK